MRLYLDAFSRLFGRNLRTNFKDTKDDAARLGGTVPSSEPSTQEADAGASRI